MLSPVKINLGLEVFHRRPADGYHYLASLFIPISFGDEIEIRDNPRGDRFTSENLLPAGRREAFEAVSERGNPEGNLIWKALQALEPERRTGVAVHLRKRVPAGTGVGGGSSNAGQVIRYLARRDGIDSNEAIRIARTVGSDVPFFLGDGAALVGGTGEILTPFPLGPGHGVLCLPPVFVNTGAAYQDLKRTLQETPPPKSMSSLSDDLSRALECSDWDRAGTLQNDFEKPVFARHPELAALKAAFQREGAAYASLSGSGSAVYALVFSPEEQRELARKMESSFPDYPFHSFEFPVA